MSKFFSGSALSQEITKLLTGEEVCCAVAFWGTGATAHLFPKKKAAKAARIICDISMGATNPAELRRLGAPDNVNLKHADRLHAKVYLSSNGAIICSANASENGVGFSAAASLIEAGVFLEPSSAAYREVIEWFEATWASSKIVDALAIETAQDLWTRRARSSLVATGLGLPADGPSLFATIAANPKRFRNVGFVVTMARADQEQAEEARMVLLEPGRSRSSSPLTSAERARLEDWGDANTFTDWSEGDLDFWRRKFVGIHRPNSRVSYAFYRKVHDVLLREDEGVVFAEQPRGLRQELGFASGKDAMLANDREILDTLFAYCEKNDKWIFEDGNALLAAITSTQSP